MSPCVADRKRSRRRRPGGVIHFRLSGSGHTPALACAPNKDVADCLALILSTMKPFPQRDPSSCSCSSPAVSPSPGLNLLKHCGITATCAPLPSNGLHNGYVKDRHGAPVGLDGCLSE